MNRPASSRRRAAQGFNLFDRPLDLKLEARNLFARGLPRIPRSGDNVVYYNPYDVGRSLGPRGASTSDRACVRGALNAAVTGWVVEGRQEVPGTARRASRGQVRRIAVGDARRPHAGGGLPPGLVWCEVLVHLLSLTKRQRHRFPELVLVCARHPRGVAVEVAHHRHARAAQVARGAVRRHMTTAETACWLCSHAISRGPPGRRGSGCGARRLTRVHATHRDLDCAVLREQVGEIVPQQRRQ